MEQLFVELEVFDLHNSKKVEYVSTNEQLVLSYVPKDMVPVTLIVTLPAGFV